VFLKVKKTFLKFLKKHLADKKKAFTFALPNEKMGGQKRPKDLWKFGSNSTESLRFNKVMFSVTN